MSEHDTRLEAWIEREFSGHGLAMRRREDPPIPGEPLMSMAIAKDLTRQAVSHSLARITAERDAAREALHNLIAASNEVGRLGANTGPQWTRLIVALAQAKAALASTERVSSEQSRPVEIVEPGAP